VAESEKQFLHWGVTLERAREVVKEHMTQDKRHRVEGKQEIPFSKDAKRVFEAALTVGFQTFCDFVPTARGCVQFEGLGLQESKRLSMSFIAPEHIVVALLNIGDSTTKQIVQALGISTEDVRTEALKRLRQEQEGEGHSKKMMAVREQF
jgi:Clp amino terminal domain, pathogenicity island component